MHARRQIVNAAAAALAGLASTGSRVYPGRDWPVSADSADYLLVYARQETSQSATMKGAARSLQRVVRLMVDGVTSSFADNDAQLDAIAEEVEAALAADPSLGGLAKDLFLASTEIVVTTGENERRLGRVRLEFAVIYYTAANAPGTAL